MIKTGLGGALGNKGAVGIRFNIDQSKVYKFYSHK